MAPPILSGCDNVVFDCDGVVYVGSRAVPGITELLHALRNSGRGVRFVTNDTTRHRSDIAAHIGACGVDVADNEVLDAGWATARLAARRGARRALTIGTVALAAYLTAEGVETVRCAEITPRDVVDAGPFDTLIVGNDPDLHMSHMEAAIAAWRPGMLLIAGNDDATYPGAHGRRMGCGALAAAVTHAVGTRPEVAGKPAAVLFDEAAATFGQSAGRIAMVGDSVRSDVTGANAAGWTSVWLRHDGALPDGDAVADHVIGDLAELLPLDAPA
jgi:glycerol 3-phosphatase-2